MGSKGLVMYGLLYEISDGAIISSGRSGYHLLPHHIPNGQSSTDNFDCQRSQQRPSQSKPKFSKPESLNIASDPYPNHGGFVAAGISGPGDRGSVPAPLP